MVVLLKINYFLSAKIENSNKPNFKPVQIDLFLLKLMDLSQVLLAREEVQWSSTKECLLYGLLLSSDRSYVAGIVVVLLYRTAFISVFCLSETFYQRCGLCVQHPSKCAACF